jgi:hypothetical protein
MATMALLPKKVLMMLSESFPNNKARRLLKDGLEFGELFEEAAM